MDELEIQIAKLTCIFHTHLIYDIRMKFVCFIEYRRVHDNIGSIPKTTTKI